MRHYCQNEGCPIRPYAKLTGNGLELAKHQQTAPKRRLRRSMRPLAAPCFGSSSIGTTGLGSPGSPGPDQSDSHGQKYPIMDRRPVSIATLPSITTSIQPSVLFSYMPVIAGGGETISFWCCVAPPGEKEMAVGRTARSRISTICCGSHLQTRHRAATACTPRILWSPASFAAVH